jgi:hypothetical protein
MMTMNGHEAAALELAAMRRAWRDLAVRWGLTLDERRALLPHGGEQLPSPPADTETRMRIMIEIGYRVRFETPAELDDWLRTPLEMWKWNSPLDMMSGSISDLRRIRQFVEMGTTA